MKNLLTEHPKDFCQEVFSEMGVKNLQGLDFQGLVFLQEEGP